MSRLDPAVAAGRLAVRRWLDPPLADAVQSPSPLVLVACSGGADSLALAAVTAFEAPRRGWRAGAVVVDHGLLEDSAAVAATAAAQCRGLGLAPVEVVRVEVDRSAGEGIEAAARRARYAALEAVAASRGAEMVLLGHTLDDQAETVLLALARGSGVEALTGMAARRGRFVRPFLELTRAQTEQIAQAQALQAWQDPTNRPDGPYPSTRSRVRAELMPLAKQVLGPDFDRALARSAAKLRWDREFLDARAEELVARAVEAVGPTASGIVLQLRADLLAAADPAMRTRALHRAALQAGARAGSLNSPQIEALDRLVAHWHGQGPVHLAGGIVARRKCGKLEFRAIAPRGEPDGRSGRGS